MIYPDRILEMMDDARERELAKPITQRIEEKFMKGWEKPAVNYWNKLKENVANIDDEDEMFEKLADEDIKSESKFTISNVLVFFAVDKYGINYRNKLPKVYEAYNKKGF